MLIFKEKDKKEKRQYKFIKEYLKKRIVFKTISLLFFGVIIFTPLDLINNNRRFYKYRKYLLSATEILDKRARYLLTETLDYGDSLFNISLRYIQSVFVNEDRLNINISFKNFKKLQTIRNQAVKDGILIRSLDDKVNAWLEYRGISYPVKIRLKGDWTDHLLGEKWSFRVETRKGKSLLGMNELSLQHPRTRNYLNELIFHKLLKYENLPYLRYKFLPISINGKNLGVYALEEHFSKELIENSGFREGPIIKISDQNYRSEEQRKKTLNYQSKIRTTNQNNSEVLTFNIDKAINNPSQISQTNLATNLLNQILKKEVKTSEVFDLKLTAKYFALCDLLGAANANTWFDMRYYFNPISSRLIPIGYDAQFPIRNRNRLLSYDLNVIGLFNEPIFLKEYLKELARVSNPKYLDEFLSEIDADIKSEISIINKTFPHVTFIKDELYKNQAYIKNRLDPLDPLSILLFKPINSNKKIETKLFNKSFFPIQVINFKYNNKIYYPVKNNVLDPRKKFQRMNYSIMEFTEKESNSLDNKKIKENEIIIKYKLDGIDKIYSNKIKILPYTESTKSSNQLITKKTNIASFPDLNIKIDEKLITLKNNFVVDRPIIFPKNYKILIKAGTTISLKNNGIMLIKGPLIIEGTKDNPVNIYSEGEAMGILVLDSKLRSNLKHVIFNNLDSPNLASINVTGGVTFYNSPVEISYSQFLSAKSEDALNIIRSTFKIKYSYFKNTFSDAIDIDFSEGHIENSQFFKIGNDAIDISGSLVTLNKIKINSAFDKAISVGENSNVIAKDLKIEKAFIGIASKDLSSININDSEINNTEICLAAYQKKPEYGPASIKTLKNENTCMPFNYILEDGSSINSNSEGLSPNTLNAYKKLYPTDK